MSPSLKEFLRLLAHHGVEYLLVGGYAVAAHGHPRYTKDIDLWIRQTQENADRVIRVLSDFGFDALGLGVADLMEQDVVIQLGRAPNRIDLLTNPSGVDFETCYAKRVQICLEGVGVDLIDLESLRANKRAAGRHQDLADLENLEL